MTLDLIDTLIGVGSATVIAITGLWSQRRTQREQTALARREWQELFDLQAKALEVLEARIKDMQDQIDSGHITIQRITRQAQAWNERNAIYYEQIQELRSRLARLGHDPGPAPNGE
jgi:Flp pilus assembly protein TadB